MEQDKKWVCEYIQAAKELENQLENENPVLADEVGEYTDRFYPQDVVKEILLDGAGTVNDEVPPLSTLQEEYYYCQELAGEYSFCSVEEEHVEILKDQLLNMKFWLPKRDGDEKILFYRYEAGEHKGKPLYFMGTCLNVEEQIHLIQKFRQWYGDTDQDTELFGAESYIVISGILDGMLVLNPKYLLLEDVLEELVELLPETVRQYYVEGFYRIKDGCQPVPCT